MNGPVYDHMLDSMDGEELYDFFRPFSEQALFNGTYKKCAARQQTMYICVHLFFASCYYIPVCHRFCTVFKNHQKCLIFNCFYVPKKYLILFLSIIFTTKIAPRNVVKWVFASFSNEIFWKWNFACKLSPHLRYLWIFARSRFSFSHLLPYLAMHKHA